MWDNTTIGSYYSDNTCYDSTTIPYSSDTTDYSYTNIESTRSSEPPEPTQDCESCIDESDPGIQILDVWQFLKFITGIAQAIKPPGLVGPAVG